jgi:hypothetical protein
MPLLLTESLEAARREPAHQHIEGCAACAEEWAAYRETWSVMEDLPEVEPPARVREKFLAAAGLTPAASVSNVVPFRSRPAFKWIAQAAALVLIAGAGYFAGDRNAERVTRTPATITGVSPIQQISASTPLSIAETRVINASAISPDIQGRPDISNVQFVDQDATDNEIAVSFDINSRWTVKGNPRDRSMVRLLSYMLENEDAVTPRGSAIEWVRRTYSDPANADPEIANAFAKVLRNDTHEGVRIRAAETLTSFPPSAATDQTRAALIEVVKNDPNPAVRLKAVEALANQTRSGGTLDSTMVDTLREKVAQEDENLYIRAKAAEALGNIKQQ